jgi:hypothetical protein
MVESLPLNRLIQMSQGHLDFSVLGEFLEDTAARHT